MEVVLPTHPHCVRYSLMMLSVEFLHVMYIVYVIYDCAV